MFVDELSGQLDPQGVVALGVERDHVELTPGDTPLGIDLFYRHFRGSTALHAVTGALLGQRHQKTDIDLVPKCLYPRWQRHKSHQHGAEQHTRSLHSVSPSPERILVSALL
jgi:hypothetical protein